MPKLAGAHAEAMKEHHKKSLGFLKLRIVAVADAMTLKVVEGRALKACDSNGFSDPYVKVTRTKQKKKCSLFFGVFQVSLFVPCFFFLGLLFFDPLDL